MIEPHLLGNIAFFAILARYKHVRLEISDYYNKQTYRNRYEILTANGVQKLSVPVHSKSHSYVKDIRIDYGQTWVKDHLRAWQGAYAKSPFYDHFSPVFFQIFNKKHTYLIDLSTELLTTCLNMLQSDMTISFTTVYDANVDNHLPDYRNIINAKKRYNDQTFYTSFAYTQNFGNTFVPNLSVIDVLFNCGMDSLKIIKASRKQPQEQI